ncbi:MAG: radical SAM protein [Deltaproteobacteria bacterium]|nr:radical SAM protein [Deltaproteobacteria bacterium]
MFKHLFGPVPSRRLGMSLGIDLVPHKVCSLNCVYCECGKTTNLTLKRDEYIPFDEIIKEIDEYFLDNELPDYITFSGSGEPTLHNRIGDIIKYIKDNYPKVPVAVLTSGTLFYDKRVRDELLDADLVLPSIDAATKEAFLRINRPDRALDVTSHIESLIDFRKEFKGDIWLEVMILPGINDDAENLAALKEAIIKINPEQLQINTLDRPGAVDNIRAATNAELNEIVTKWNIPNTYIIKSAPSRKKITAYREDTESAILETIKRRPLTLLDIRDILGLHINEINKYLDILEEEKKIEAVRLDRGLFYKIVNP